MNGHMGRGFWCDFCKDYHPTLTCPHPAFSGVDQEEYDELEAQLDREYDRAEALEDEVHDKDKILDAIEDLMPDLEKLDADLYEKFREALAG